MVGSAGQVHSCRVAAEARSLTRSNVHRSIRTMSTGEEGRSRTARHELLKIVPNTDNAAALVRVCFKLLCTLRGNYPPRSTVDTCIAGANATDLLPDVVVSAGEALRSGIAVGEVVSPSWPRGCTVDATDVSAAVTADIAAAAAAAMGVAVVAAVAAIGVAGVVAQGASVADGPVAGCDLDHRCGAWLSVCRGGLAHGLHLQLRFGRCPHEQRLARGLRRSASLGPTGSSPPEQAHCIQTDLIGESGVKLPSTVRFILRAGVVTLYLASFIKLMCT